MELQGQWAELLPRAKQALIDVVDSGRYILGPQVRGLRGGGRRRARRRPRHRRRERHRRPRPRAARRRRRARRRGDLPVVHLLRHGRGDRRRRRRRRCSPTSAPTTTSIRRQSTRRSRPGRAPSSPSTCSATRPICPRCAPSATARPRPGGGCRPGVRRRRRRGPGRRRGDVLVLPDEEPVDVRRWRAHHDAAGRRGRHLPDAALPRLQGQADVHADRLQLAPRRAARGGPARVPRGSRRLERGPPGRRRRGTAIWGWTSTRRCRPTAASTTCT